MPHRRDPDPYLPNHGSADYVVEHYALDLRYRVEPNRLEGTARLGVRAVEACTDLRLDLIGLRVARVEVGGRPAKFAANKRSMRVRLPRPLAPGATATVAITYAGNPRPGRGPWGETGWEELGEGVLVAGQPDGAPTWFPCNDRLGPKSTIDLTLTTDAPYTVVANAPVAKVTRRAGTRTWVFQRTEPLNVYLATVQIGRYDVVPLDVVPRDETPRDEAPRSGAPATSSGARATPLVQVARPAPQAAAVAHDLDRHGALLAVFEELFGPYPFAAYTVVVTPDELEIPLEAHGTAVFGANHLDGSKPEDRLVAHELAHQWFGNSVTAARWSDIWLHEGFACYAEWLWSERSGGPSAAEHAAEHHARLAGLPQDLLLTDPGPDLMFDDRTYKRGALTLHALRTVVGDDRFFGLLHAWTERFRHGTATTSDFRALVAERCGAAAAGALTPWLDARPLPALPA
ncbi:M1 family metallopeptidase [Xylanimonas protaetiae]|uniref:Aminopeptidase N n=1 Tax=Xylanimonas protaetiae TaxID=2509457 RepID=A0A4P6F967_9MICO|nr:M1 family metallopeptidase [Xylanimonas protaetiae]QAY69887.1 M1 family peptidase [Xylanimonas protaetiae]